MSTFYEKIVSLFVFPYFLYLFDLGPDFVMLLNKAHFGHEDPYTS